MPITYETPAVNLDGLTIEEHPGPVWVVAVAAWASALWFAWYCRRTGGWPSIGWSWFRFRITCYR